MRRREVWRMRKRREGRGEGEKRELKNIESKSILSKNRAFGIWETIPKVYIWVVRGPEGEERLELGKIL